MGTVALIESKLVRPAGVGPNPKTHFRIVLIEALEQHRIQDDEQDFQ